MLRRPGSIKLLDLFGIRISVDAGWFLTLFLVILWLSPSFRSTLNSTDGVAYLTTVVSALLFFASLVVHELGHAVVARRNGIEVRNIQLFLFGGLTQMSREARTPGEEFRIAAAGPAATFLMVIVFLVVDLAIVGPHLLWDAIRLAPNVRITPVLLGLSWLLLMNVVVLLFNLVPAFPLDGGRIARALVWRKTGDKRRGTRAAAQLGQGFAVILAGIGIWMMLSGNAFGGLWLVLLAFLLGQSARGALMQTALTERIEGVRVSDIMDRQPVAIPARTPVTQASGRVLPALRLVLVPGRRRQRAVPGDLPPGAAAGGRRRWRGLADGRRGARFRGDGELAGQRGPAADRAVVIRAAGAARGADGRRRRGRAARRRDRRAGPAGAAVSARSRRPPALCKTSVTDRLFRRRGCDPAGVVGRD